MAIKRKPQGSRPAQYTGALARGIEFRRHIEQEVRRGRFRSQAEAIWALRAKVWGEPT